MSQPQAQTSSASPAGMEVIPPETQEFLEELHDHLYARDSVKLQFLYERVFTSVSEQHYASKPWPAPTVVAAFYKARGNEHDIVMVLYQQLYFRYIFARFPERATWDDRQYSWETYQILFDYLLTNECNKGGDASLAIPSLWLWDMFDDFVYQFRDTQLRKWRYIADFNSTSPAATGGSNPPATMVPYDDLRNSNDWEFMPTSTWLYKFMETTDILKTLRDRRDIWISAMMKSGIETKAILCGENSSDGSVLSLLPLSNSLCHKLGLVALIAAARLSNITCEYQHALDVLKDLPLLMSPALLFVESPLCQANLYYNAAVALMMSRRFSEAIKVASVYLIGTARDSRGGNYHKYPVYAAQYQRDALQKLGDQLYTIIMLCHSLASYIPIDPYIVSNIKENMSARFMRLQAEDPATFAEMFKRACPRYVSAQQCRPGMKDTFIVAGQPGHITENQLAIFMQGLEVQKQVVQLASYAKLYNNIKLSRLAVLMGFVSSSAEPNSKELIEATERVRHILLSVRHSCRTFGWFIGGTSQEEEQQPRLGACYSIERPLSGGNAISDQAYVPIGQNIGFVIEDDTLHVEAHQTEQVYAHAYVKQTMRVRELLAAIRKLPPIQREEPQPSPAIPGNNSSAAAANNNSLLSSSGNLYPRSGGSLLVPPHHLAAGAAVAAAAVGTPISSSAWGGTAASLRAAAAARARAAG